MRFHFNKRLYHEVPDHQEVETYKKSESSPALRHQRRKGEGKLLLLHLHLVVPKHDSHVGLILSEKYEWVRGELKYRRFLYKTWQGPPHPVLHVCTRSQTASPLQNEAPLQVQ